jgi:hypothetical protein
VLAFRGERDNERRLAKFMLPAIGSSSTGIAAGARLDGGGSARCLTAAHSCPNLITSGNRLTDTLDNSRRRVFLTDRSLTKRLSSGIYQVVKVKKNSMK